MAEASYPDGLKYHPEHDWASIDGDVATFGITWYAQDQLGEVVFVDPPEVGKSVTKDEPYAEIESVKAVSDGPASRTARTASAPMKPVSSLQHHPRPASIGPRSSIRSLP